LIYGDTVSLYRAIGYEELVSLMKTRHFKLRPGGMESKHFGRSFNDTLDFANMAFNIHVVAIVKAVVIKSVLEMIGDFTDADLSVFKSGTVEIHKEHLSEFNNAIIDVKHMV